MSDLIETIRGINHNQIESKLLEINESRDYIIAKLLSSWDELITEIVTRSISYHGGNHVNACEWLFTESLELKWRPFDFMVSVEWKEQLLKYINDTIWRLEMWPNS